MGGYDLVRPLALAGVHSAVVGRPHDSARHSRFVFAMVDGGGGPDALVERLLAAAARHPEPPALYYGQDPDLLFVSRNRERLAGGFRFVVPDADLVEALVEKTRFHALAERLGLPVPRMRILRSGEPLPADLDLAFPLVLKPAETYTGWRRIAPTKAVSAATRRELERQWALVVDAGIDVLAQEFVVGPETRIESYHAYVDARQEVAADFTGRKIRTMPLRYGDSTAVEITDDDDVRATGRAILRALGLTGVVKLDFKRDPAGALWLLEANPRFNLWHHPGAVAGVNLPALVHADLYGVPRRVAPVRAGVRWCDPLSDPAAARASGMSAAAWSAWALRCDAKAHTTIDDPVPFLRDVLWPRVSKRLHAGAR